MSCRALTGAVEEIDPAQIFRLTESRIRQSREVAMEMIARHYARLGGPERLAWLMESADRSALFDDPRHPYTKALLSAAPIPDPKTERTRKRVRLTGEPPSPMDPRAALRFLPSRLPLDPTAPFAAPELMEVAPGHLVAEFDPPLEAA